MKQPVERGGDVWTWTALARDSKLIVSWLRRRVGAGLHDKVKNRLTNRVQRTIHGNRAYLNASRKPFGADIDYAMLVK